MESAPKRNVWNDFVHPPLSYKALNFLQTFHKNIGTVDSAKFRKKKKHRRFNTARSEAGEAVRQEEE